MDIPNARSSHDVPTPRGGGLSIVLVWFVGITILYLSNNMEPNLYFALLSGIILAIVSLFDDIFSQFDKEDNYFKRLFDKFKKSK